MAGFQKHCVVKTCNGYPAFGFGKPSSPHMVWACGEHKTHIGFGGTSPDVATKGGAQQLAKGASGAAAAPVPQQRQGALW